MYSTASVSLALHVWVAPKSLAHCELLVVDVDGDDRGGPGQIGPGDRCVADAAASEHGDRVTAPDVAGVHRCAETGHHAASEQSGGGGRGLGIDRRALARVHQRLVDEGADAERRRQLGAVGQRHLLGGVERREAVPRLALQARPAGAAHRPPVEDHVVAGLDVGDAGADGLDDAGRLVAEQERELVVDAALAVVQIGVAHPARLDLDDGLARPRVGDDDRLERDRGTLRTGDDSLYFLRHGSERNRPSAAPTPVRALPAASKQFRRSPASATPSESAGHVGLVVTCDQPPGRWDLHADSHMEQHMRARSSGSGDRGHPPGRSIRRLRADQSSIAARASYVRPVEVADHAVRTGAGRPGPCRAACRSRPRPR